MQTDIVRIGTRGSALALAQASEVRAHLMAAHDWPEEAFAVEVISTSGDRILDRPLSEAGGKGLFVKEIEEALLERRIDLAVHSSKDMPSFLPPGLELSAFLEREDPRDAFISRSAGKLADLPGGATIGSASLRRQALVKRLRPDVDVAVFRGNVQTRLRKLDAGDVDATLLAYAGLRRLRLTDLVTELLPLDRFPPAPGQGAICVETRRGDGRMTALLAAIHHVPTGEALACERSFLAALDGSCRTPLAGYARLSGDSLVFSGLVLTPDGAESHEIELQRSRSDPAALGLEAANQLRERAGTRFFENWG